MGAVVGLAEPWPLALVIDHVIDTNPPPQFLQSLFGSNPDQYRLLAFIVGAGFLIVIISHGVRVLNDYVNAKVEQNIVMDLRSDMFAHCERLSLTFHDERHTGQLMSQINMQASAIGSIVMAFPPILESFLMLIGMLVIALLIDWQVTLVSMIAVPFIYYSIGIYGTRIVPRIQRVQSLEFRSLSIVFEAMSMLRVIVSFGRERHEHYRFVKQGRVAVDARVRLTVWQTLFALMVTTATALGTALVLGFGALHVIQNKISLGELTVLISYIAAVYQPLESISLTIGHLHQYFVYFNASVALLIEDPEVMEDPDPIEIERARGDVEFHQVGFSYKGRKDTLKDITFKAEAGQRIAVVGPTGAGKTTLISLLVRFYDPKSGSITIDGIDMKKLSLDSLRGNISLVLQEPLLFSGSIEDNIRYGRLNATKSDIVEAAKAANAHDFISKLPEGYDTELGERGAQLSGGERQRVCVARAFIRDAPILILDEPTSSIDSRTELVILDALDRLMVGRTSFMIAHRLSTVRKADKILVINQGRLVEQGSHEELVTAGGLYYRLYEAQSGDIAKLEADHLRRSQEAQPALPAGAVPAGVGAPVDGGVESQVAESLTRAVRRRIKVALDSAEQANGHEPNGNGAHPPADGEGDAAPPAAPAGEHDPPK
jgi:ATP-binding cassette subfamily B protein/subfamily B ATP-binding cassette protein MsbA